MGGLKTNLTTGGAAWLKGCKVLLGAVKLVFPFRRFAIFGLGGRTGRPRVSEGDSGRLPELILGSRKITLELSGGHFGFFEGHF